MAAFVKLVCFDPGGLEEAGSTVGSPNVQSTVKRTGGYALECAPAATEASFRIEKFDGGSYANDVIVGFAYRVTDVTPGANVGIVLFRPASGLHGGLVLKPDGNIQFIDTSQAGVGSAGAPGFVVDTWHYIVVRFERGNSAAAKCWVDGSQIISVTGADFQSATDTLDQIELRGGDNTGGNPTVYFDDVYVIESATADTDRFDDFECLLSQNTVEDATDVGDTLDIDTWALASEVPADQTSGHRAGYSQASTAQSGGMTTDEGARTGPNGDARVDADSSIKAALWLFNLARGSGTATTHYLRWGNDADGMQDDSVSLTASFVIHERVSEAANRVPTSSEYFQIGLRKDADGTQAIVAGELWCILGHRPARSIAVGLASESSSGFAVGIDKAREPGLATENDSGLVARPVRLVPASLAAETDTALVLASIAKSQSVGLATGADTALSVGRAKLLATGLASEADTALAVTIARLLAVGLATTAATAFAIGRAKDRSTGLALEADVGLAVGALKALTVGLPSEIDASLAVGRAKLRALGLGTEADSALEATIDRALAVALASESNTALAVTGAKARALALALESDSALAAAAVRIVALGLAAEIDTALALVLGTAVAVGLASEADAALAVGRLKTLAVGLAQETDISFGVVARVASPERTLTVAARPSLAIGAADRALEVAARAGLSVGAGGRSIVVPAGSRTN